MAREITSNTSGSGVEISLHIGQRVRHRDHRGQRVTGVVNGISVDSDRLLQADLVLDAPIVIPALSPEDREISIWRQHVPAHELAPFDDRDELIADLLAALEAEQEWQARDAVGEIEPDWDYERMVGDKRRSAIARARGCAT